MDASHRDGRDEEFVEFAAARRAGLVRTAYLLCGDRHRAEDLAQQTLTKLYLAWNRVSRAGSVEAYARRTLVNAHLDDVRRPWWRRERAVAEPPEPSALVGARPADPSELTSEADALWTALRALAPGQRRVVVLRHYLGLSVEETAADLQISTGTVKSQTSDALARLRDALSESPIGPLSEDAASTARTQERSSR